ncbi:MAG: carboxymuconolactone decarboxylase family protein [Acidimicrobiales bacterium]|jgi:4-carboxymuconolactone decarboxylase|nr:carboxymuconolactone decarboxylase family protein [Acidimicrobiales bacterium]|tara:strand:+ start:1293 stop:1706 length:414 start_codon:yes stop_codon:yes gene_type:complete
MSDEHDEHDEHDERSAWERGLARMREVYGDEVREIPEGVSAFNDVMLRSLFAEVWDRDVLSFRDRRLLAMGVIAANGATDIWGLQARSALANGELTVEELRETLVFLAPYAGYPNVAPLVGVTEKAIAGADSEPGGG